MSARVAQLVEHLTRNEKVVSSILASGSKINEVFFEQRRKTSACLSSRIECGSEIISDEHNEEVIL